MVKEFRLEDVNHSPAFFDIKKLASFNGDYIRAMTLDAFIEAAAPVLASTDAWPTDRFDADVFQKAAPLVQTRVVTLSEIPGMVDFLFLENPTIDDDAWNKTMSADFAREVLNDFSAAMPSVEWNHDSLKGVLEVWTESHGLKLGKTQAPIRVAITGRTVGPPLFESLEILGRDETVSRLAAGIARLG